MPSAIYENGDSGVEVNPTMASGLRGQHGWSMVTALVADGERRVRRLVDWTGGEGIKPDVGGYLGPLGLVADIAAATDDRGPKGEDGNEGVPGAPGEDGADGKSLYQVAVDNGFVGTELEWLSYYVNEISEAATAEAIEARDLSQAWASSPTDVTPGNPSAKTSAAAAGTSAQTAEDRAAETVIDAAAAEAAKTAAESAAGASLTNATSRAEAITRTFPALVTHVITGGYAEAGDRGGADFVEGDGTSPGGFIDAGLRGFQIIPSHERISLRQAGIVFDDESEASANRTKLNALSTWCEARKIDVEVNKGTCYVTANNGVNTGWNIYPSTGTGFLRVFGHGEDSVIKRAATATLAASSSLTWVYANANGKLTLENFKFDGNEANCPYDAGNPFAHEQSAALRMRAAAIAGTFEALELYGMRMTGLVADGYQGAVAINRFVA
ncbi:MAG: hypothetical protein EOS08_33095, partial [Mesorhizobium sp.]